MLILIDESGDPGFKISKGSSPTFVVAMVIFHDFKEAEKTSLAISQVRDVLRVKPEFKFNKFRNGAKDGFFEAIKSFQFSVRALVVIKDQIYSTKLRTQTDRFYNYFVQSLLKYDNDVLKDARIKIDGSGARGFKRELQAYLRRQLGAGKIKSIKFADSRRDNLIQLADMATGAIARSYNQDARGHADKWLKILRDNGKIEDIWEFK